MEEPKVIPVIVMQITIDTLYKRNIEIANDSIKEVVHLDNNRYYILKV